MKIEILYPELCTLYGDKGNMQYLKLCLPDAEFVETTLNAKPLFLTEDIKDATTPTGAAPGISPAKSGSPILETCNQLILLVNF